MLKKKWLCISFFLLAMDNAPLDWFKLRLRGEQPAPGTREVRKDTGQDDDMPALYDANEECNCGECT